jgi:benzoyl-CoA 2,3-dioxygenase component B
VDRWNKIIDSHGLDAELVLPHRGFHRAIGAFAGMSISPDGRVVSRTEWEAHRRQWLPTEDDAAFIQSLMQPVVEPGRVASWIAAPLRGINGQPGSFEYVRLA